MLRVIAIALGVLSAPFAAYADVAANTFTDEEGVWSAGFERDRGTKFILSIRMIDGHGLLDVEDAKWTVDKEYKKCRYHFAYDNMTVERTYLNQAMRGSELCIAEFPFTLERIGPDVLRLMPDAGLASFIGIEAFDMQASLRPPLPQDAAAEVEGLDILGMKPGMQRPEVQTILQDRGYTLFKEDPSDFRSYVVPAEIWARDPLEEGAGGATFANSVPFRDVITVHYSAQAEWIDDAPYVVHIERRVKPDDAAALTELTLQQAFIDKYGERDRSSNEVRSFDRLGQHDPSHKACQAGRGTHQHVPFKARGLEFDASVYCGPIFMGNLSSNLQTGMINGYGMQLRHPDQVWRNFWMIWSKPEGDELERLFASMSREGSAAPEL